MKKIIVILALLTGLWTDSLADNNADPNMMIHYSFGNVNGKTVADESGNGYNATLYNNATVTAMGKYKVMNLGTSSGYLDMGASAGNILKNTSDFTISTYYMVDDNASLSGNGYYLWAFSQLAANSATSAAYMTKSSGSGTVICSNISCSDWRFGLIWMSYVCSTQCRIFAILQ